MRIAIYSICVISIIGLGIYQYHSLKIGLTLNKIQLDEKMGNTLSAIEHDLAFKNELSYLIGTAITNDTSYFTMPIHLLMDTASYFLSDFLKYRMELNGVKTTFQFELINELNEVILTSSSDFRKDDRFTYRLALNGYLASISRNQVFILVYLTNANKYLLGRLNSLIIPSIIFFLLLIICIAWIVSVLTKEIQLNYITHEFINNFTHELNTPVFSIGLAVNVLNNHVNTSPGEKLLEIIRRDNNKIKLHIDRVLSLTKLESKRELVQMSRLDIRSIVKEIVDYWELRFHLKEGVLIIEDNAVNTWIKGDKLHIKSALDNVIDNAVKYSENNPFIILSLNNNDDKLCINIKDKGVGIDKKFIKHVFTMVR